MMQRQLLAVLPVSLSYRLHPLSLVAFPLFPAHMLLSPLLLPHRVPLLAHSFITLPALAGILPTYCSLSHPFIGHAFLLQSHCSAYVLPRVICVGTLPTLSTCQLWFGEDRGMGVAKDCLFRKGQGKAIPLRRAQSVIQAFYGIAQVVWCYINRQLNKYNILVLTLLMSYMTLRKKNCM